MNFGTVFSFTKMVSRVLPFGEVDDDSLGINRRKAQGIQPSSWHKRFIRENKSLKIMHILGKLQASRRWSCKKFTL